MTRLRWAWMLSAIVGLVSVGLMTLLVLQYGTHSVYCPAASGFWIFKCLPTPMAVAAALGMFAVAALTVFPFAWLLTRFKARW